MPDAHVFIDLGPGDLAGHRFCVACWACTCHRPELLPTPCQGARRHQ